MCRHNSPQQLRFQPDYLRVTTDVIHNLYSRDAAKIRIICKKKANILLDYLFYVKKSRFPRPC